MISRRIVPFVAAAIIGYSTFCTSSIVIAQSSAGPNAPVAKVDAKARVILDSMMAAYKNASSYSGKIELQTTGLPDAPRLKGQLTVQQPNKFKIVGTDAAGTTSAVSDGTQFFLTISRAPNQYMQMDAPPSRAVFKEALGQVGADGTALASLLVGQDPLKAFALSLQAVDVGDAAKVEGAGEDTDVVVARFSRGRTAGSVTYVIGKTDHLLRRATLSQTVGDKTLTVTEIHDQPKVGSAVSGTAFLFTPRAGAERVAEFPEPNYDPRLVVGGDPFALGVKDTAGQIVNLEDYKGKVVLLDFWASWCPPCAEDAPEVTAVYQGYKIEGFDIIGVSLDYEGEAMQEFTERFKMPWRQIFDGGGWKSEISTLYGVGSIPFTLLIGRDGKIAAIGARGQRLQRAVQNALDGKRTPLEPEL